MSRAVSVLMGIVLLTSCHVPSESPSGTDYTAWSNSGAHRMWTMAAEAAVTATDLISQTPKDIDRFCPSYPSLSLYDKSRFWAGLLSAMAKFESNFDTQTAFTETLRDSQGNPVVSRGLLQISVESANQERYGCGTLMASDLHNPVVNLSCGARILSKWVRDDGVISHSETRVAGGGRYWSVLRPNNQNLTKIKTITRGFYFCGAESSI